MRIVLVSFLFSISFSSFVRSDVTRTEAEALKLINHIYDELQKGASFSQLVIAYSEDEGSVNTDGEYHDFPRDFMLPEFEERAWTMPLHEISKPFKINAGYDIMEVLERTAEKVGFRHIFIKFKTE